MKKVVLVVDGIDIDDDATDEACAEVAGSHWMCLSGITTVTHFTNADPIAAAEALASDIHAKVPGARVTAWYADLVSATQIAQRVGVSAEAVRLWSTGKRGKGSFPAPLGRVGGGGKTSPVWRWADVATWFREEMHLDMDEAFPSHREIAFIDAHLADSNHTAPRGVSYTPPAKRSVGRGAAVVNMRVTIVEHETSAMIGTRARV